MKERYQVRVELRRTVKNGPGRIIKQEDKEYDLLEDAIAAFQAAEASTKGQEKERKA